MRPNAQSGCCTLENAANPATIRNLHTTYPLSPTVHLHSHLHSHPHQQTQQQQQQNRHHHNFHTQQQHLQPLHFKPQVPTPWLPPQGLYNATPHPSTTSKNVVIGRHQALPFVAQSPTPLIKSQNHQQQHHQMLPAPPPPPHSHPQHQYQQYLNSLQHQSTHFPQKSKCVSQSTSTAAVAHHFNGYTSANTPRMALPPDQLSAAMPTVAPPSHPSNFAKLPSASVVNQQRVNECAGIPLISNATTHLASNQRQRVQRKLSRSPAPHQKLSTTGGTGTYKLQHPCAGLYITRSANAASCSHISQMAAHAQGAPLLVHKQQQQQNSAPKWPMPNSSSSAFQSTVSPQLSSNSSASSAAGGGKSHSEKPSRTTLRYQHSAPAALSTRGKENTTQATPEPAAFAETSTDKDNADGGETALPRIIKPRKRRKKDRKPTTNGVLLKFDALAGTGIASEADRKSVQAHMPDMQQSQLLPRHHQQLQQQQQHLTHLYPHENSNENLYKFINFYIGTHQSTENVVSTRAFNSNEPLLDFKPRSLLHLKSFDCLGGIKHKQGDMSQDEHGICFCQDCDPLRSIWDYPLKRSLSDSSAASIRTHSSSSSSSSSSHGSSSETTSSSGSSAPLTDDALSPSTTLSRADRVGVIGSNRNGQDCNRGAAKRTDTGCEVLGGRHPMNGFLSDSNDSGYGDILSGINIADDFFSQSAYNMSTALRPLFEANDLMLDVGQSSIDQSMKSAQSYSSAPETLLPLLPATADALLTESINEISRKLIEACGSEQPNELTRTTTRSISAYSRCSSDFSADSGIDSAAIVNCDELVFKFDNMNFMIDNVAKQTTNESNSNNNNNCIGTNNNNSARSFDDIAATTTTTNAFSELHKLPETATGATTTRVTNEGNCFIDKPNMNLLFDLNNNNKGNIFEIENENEELEREQLRQPLAEKNQHDQQFINNCFDLVWPTTFDHCIGVEKQLGALTHREIA